MSMTNNDEIALKEDWRDDYEKIFPIPEGMERTASYGDGISTGYINKSCFITLATVYLHRWAGYKVGREALLAEREADKALIAEQAKRIEFLKEQLAQLANFNPDWDKLEAATDSLREHMAELTEANKRIAELEARTLTVKLPNRATADKYVDGTFDNSDLAAIYNTCRLECEVKIKNACAAAGITLVVGE